jgi:2-polyprenyl-3-methyl-5-hydroxy-6-metoxy-1,4-benzoquinol methylase
MQPGQPGVELYRKAATESAGPRAYKGLAIHAFAELHERIGQLAGEHLQPGARVLDLAAGSGAMCRRLTDLGFLPTGCDIVPENFRLHDEVPFHAVNLNLPLPDALSDDFDCVIAGDVLGFLENPRHFLRQCHAALRPGGILLLSVPNVDSAFSKALFIRTGEFHWFEETAYRRGGHITPIPRTLLERALLEAGFQAPKFESCVAQLPISMRWWRMRLLTWLIGGISGRNALNGQTLVVVATRP